MRKLFITGRALPQLWLLCCAVVMTTLPQGLPAAEPPPAGSQAGSSAATVAGGPSAPPAAASETLTLGATVRRALEANLQYRQAKEETAAAEASRKVQRANFLPSLDTTYSYTHYDKKLRTDDVTLPAPLNLTIPGSVTRPQNQYAFSAQVTQTLFAGFANLTLYQLAELGLDVARIQEQVARLAVIFEAKEAYFNVLKQQKLLTVARQAVTLLEALETVAQNFYEVGMTPLNDLLEAQVELANARQEQIVAENALALAYSRFNLVLRRPVNAPVAIEDVLDYQPLPYDVDYYLLQAGRNRLELEVADLQVEIAGKDLKLAHKNYYPTVTLTGTYTELGTEPYLDGGEGISDSSSWNVAAVASWNLFEGGRTYYSVEEKKRRLSQARLQRKQTRDNIRLEVKDAYLKTQENERNILTVEKALEQARENLRINQERYKEQVATSTDVLDAQTLLTETMTRYYNALYDFKISKALLQKLISLEVLE